MQAKRRKLLVGNTEMRDQMQRLSLHEEESSMLKNPFVADKKDIDKLFQTGKR
jgi:hypothetical protein